MQGTRGSLLVYHPIFERGGAEFLIDMTAIGVEVGEETDDN